MSLADQACVPCRGDTPPLTTAEIQPLLAQVDGWDVDDAGHLRKSFRFKDFVEAVGFVNAITPIAEEQGHHPDLTVAWGHVGVELWTHKISGLTESDFVMAARIDRLEPPAASVAKP